jgi:acyl-CoA reductase-like NAD-dependent aldehyde dehydrogenase
MSTAQSMQPRRPFRPGALPPPRRGAILQRWASLMREEREDLARRMTREQGKALAEARGEIDYAEGFLDWFAARRACL